MKRIRFLFVILLATFCFSAGYSQKFSLGIYSGVNFSDIHGQDIGGKWKSKPGAIQGFSLAYSLNKSIGVQTGLNFSTVYYEHKYPSYSGPVYPYENISIDPWFYNSGDQKMDFSFMRIPFLFTVSIPAAVQFNMRAGVYFAFIQNYSLDTYNYYSYMYADKPRKKDFGYVFSSGIAYPINGHFKTTFDAAYLTGRNKFLKNYNYRYGSSEFTLGFAYTGFFKKTTTKIAPDNGRDSSSRTVTLKINGGIIYSWNKGLEKNGTYYGSTGPSLGFSLNFPVGKGGFFQTGFSFERKGYSIRDSSASLYRLIKADNPMYYVDTKVQTDYAIIPALLTFPFGKSDRLFLSTGPWLGLKLNARTSGTAYNEYRSGTEYQLKETVVYDDLEKAIKDYDFGWIFSCSVSIPVIKKFEVDLALQYSIGFMDVFSNSQSGDQQNQSDPGLRIRNRSLSLVLGFTIPSAVH